MKWYHYLNKVGEDNLMKNEKLDDENLIVCQQLSTDHDDTTKKDFIYCIP